MAIGANFDAPGFSNRGPATLNSRPVNSHPQTLIVCLRDLNALYRDNGRKWKDTHASFTVTFALRV